MEWYLENPAIAQQWSEKNGIPSSQVSRGSDRKIWWECSFGHEWETTINSRINLGSNCPYCSGRKPTKENNLAIRFPAIAAEWSERNNLRPTDVCCKSSMLFDWKCTRGHEWKATISNRTNGNQGCPFCSGRRATPENSLANNYAYLLPEIHPSNKIDPETTLPYSHVKLLWKCPKGHEWRASIASRTKMNTGCPFCCKQSSMLEMRAYCELKAIFQDAIHRDRSFGMELDIYIPSIRLGIEIDGHLWHKEKHETDMKKNDFFKGHGIDLIRLRQMPLRLLGPNDISHKRWVQSVETINKLLGVVAKISKKGIQPLRIWANDDLFRKMVAERSLVPLNIMKTHPDIADEWNYDKNDPLSPTGFSHGSNVCVWWKCKKDHEYFQNIASRVHNHGCATCRRPLGWITRRKNQALLSTPS